MQSYFTVFEDSFGRYEEKRSVFLAHLKHVETAEQAVSFIESVKAKHYDARHNTYAYVLLDGTSRFSDDGEPHGTAGKPILDVLKGLNAVNVCICVTRYFGGVLLGTGGLCHAYSTAAKDCADNSIVIKMGLCKRYKTVCDYPSFNRLQPLLASFNANIINTEYADFVTVEYSLSGNTCENYLNALRETFAANLTAESLGEEYAKVAN